ncbi:hypothetical protein MTO96_020145 [Rhipicephalus appendiculatus]
MPVVRSLKDDPQFGVDSRWSWISACFCGWVLFLASATSRVAGIFFYGIVEAFGESRSVCATWRKPLPSFTIFFGILHGCAISGMYVAANVLVAQHFEERRAVACSLVYAAGGLSNFVLPPLIEFFRTTYGIQAAFLLYGAIFPECVTTCYHP